MPRSAGKPTLKARELEAIQKVLGSDPDQFTVRQLCYQVVKANLRPNTARQYKKFDYNLTRFRERGLIDWDRVEDRTRHETGGEPQAFTDPD